MTDFIDSPNPPTPERARWSLEIGGKFPYDKPDSWWADSHDSHPVLLAPSWQVSAARGIVANLRGRRGIKYELQTDRIDEDVRQEIILTLAAIIEAAPAWYAEQQQEQGHDA